MLKKKNKKIFNNRGFSLMEVLIAMLLLSIIATTFLNVFLTSFDLSARAQNVTNNTYASQAYIEELRIYDYRELVDLHAAQTGKEPFDTNDDGIDDCFMELKLEPYGVCDFSTNSEKAVYVHVIYFVDRALVIAADADAVYVDIDATTDINLNVQTNGTECVLIAGGNRIEFDRQTADSPVVVMANLDLKDFGYNNSLEVTGDVGRVDVKAYGNDVIVEEFLSNISIQRYCGIYNISTSLVKLTVELYEESTSTTPYFEMSEIVEIYNGEKDDLLP